TASKWLIKNWRSASESVNCKSPMIVSFVCPRITACPDTGSSESRLHPRRHFLRVSLARLEPSEFEAGAEQGGWHGEWKVADESSNPQVGPGLRSGGRKAA